MAEPEARRPLDHLVLGVPDLEAGAEDIARRTGLTPVFGGRHATGTANYLLDLGGGAYLEILGLMPDARGFDDIQPFGIEHVTRPRLLTWCVQTSDIEGDSLRGRAQGYDVGEIVSLSRTSPDGDLLSWKMSRRRPMAFDGVVPFLMEWGTTPHPTTRDLPKAHLLDLQVWHPDTKAVIAALDALRAPKIPVHAGEPRMSVSIDTPKGRLELA